VSQVSVNYRRMVWGLGIMGCAAAAVMAEIGTKSLQSPFVAGAVFSDETPQFVNPAEPNLNQPFKLELRVGKNQVKSANVNFAGMNYAMTKVRSDAWFDYYGATVPGQSSTQLYYFQVQPGQGAAIYYSQAGPSTTTPANASEFEVVPGFHVPNWAKGAVFYQIFPDRFYNGDSSNDDVTDEFMYDGYPDVHVSNWSKPPDGTAYNLGGNRTREFYGGDLQGIIDKLDYLKGLGIQALYLTPIFVAPSNHKYDTQDYAHVDPHLGKIVVDGGELINPKSTNVSNQQATKYIIRTENNSNLQASDAVLQELIAKAHQMGIRVVLDGVFNHTGTFNKWFDAAHIYPNTAPVGPGAFEAKNSPFHDYYAFNGGSWPNNSNYDAWQNISSLPKLNYEQSPQLVQKIYNIAEKWVTAPYHTDGWKLDPACVFGYSPNYKLYFWDGFRTAVKSANPQALILGEYYQDPGPYFDGKGWDTVQNYNAFLTPVSGFLTGVGEHSTSEQLSEKDNVPGFLSTMQNEMGLFPYQSLYTAMNALDNHDISRFLTRTNGAVGSDDLGNTAAQAGQGVHLNILEQGVLLDMTWPGDPTVYYGDEAGLSGWTDPDNRRTFPWGHENMQLENFYRNIIHVHTGLSCFRTGSLYIFNSRASNLLAYGRFDLKSAAVTVLNVGKLSETVSLPVWKLDTQNGAVWNVRASVNQPIGQKMTEISGHVRVVVPAGGGVVLSTTST